MYEPSLQLYKSSKWAVAALKYDDFSFSHSRLLIPLSLLFSHSCMILSYFLILVWLLIPLSSIPLSHMIISYFLIPFSTQAATFQNQVQEKSSVVPDSLTVLLIWLQFCLLTISLVNDAQLVIISTSSVYYVIIKPAMYINVLCISNFFHAENIYWDLLRGS